MNLPCEITVLLPMGQAISGLDSLFCLLYPVFCILLLICYVLYEQPSQKSNKISKNLRDLPLDDRSQMFDDATDNMATSVLATKLANK